jgi:long-chain acyl-CoA synthetase
MAYALNDCRASALLIDDACLPVAEALRQDVPGLRTVVHLGDGPRPAEMLGFERAHRFRTAGA